MSINRRSFLAKLSAATAVFLLAPREAFARSTALATISENLELAIHFAVQKPEDGGRYHKPYVAVWVENEDGDLIKTVSLWRLQKEKGKKWIDDLRKWFRTTKDLDAISSATRGPGKYTVVWDGLDEKKVRAPQGNYVIYVEAAREKGPYQRIRIPVTIANTPTKQTAKDKGDLINVSAELRSR